MAKQVWLCEKCGSSYVDEEAAKRCEETSHCKDSDVKLVGLRWPARPTPGNGWSPHAPSIVVLAIQEPMNSCNPLDVYRVEYRRI